MSSFFASLTLFALLLLQCEARTSQSNDLSANSQQANATSPKVSSATTDRPKEGINVTQNSRQPSGIEKTQLSNNRSATAKLVSFQLKKKDQPIGIIRVPAGYKEETESYVEGVKATLKYPDGSYIVLHVGGMIQLPFFTEPEYEVSERRQTSTRVIRSGKVRNTELLWREENSRGVWPPTNIGFANVPKERLTLFERSLRTFALAKK